MSERRYRHFAVSHEALTEIFRSMDGSRVLLMTGIPDGAKVVGTREDYERFALAVRLESPDFSPVAPGDVIPFIEVRVGTVAADGELARLKSENAFLRGLLSDRVSESGLADGARQAERSRCEAVLLAMAGDADRESVALAGPDPHAAEPSALMASCHLAAAAAVLRKGADAVAGRIDWSER